MDRMNTDALVLPEGIGAELSQGLCDDPFRWLGMHAGSECVVVRAYLPGIESAEVVLLAADHQSVSMQRWTQDAYLFGAVIPGLDAQVPYRLRVNDGAGWSEIEDPYRFPSTLGPENFASFRAGTDVQLHHWLGAIPMQLFGCPGYRFAVWAPNARRVSVVGDFNRWDGRRHVMRRHHDAGIWELFIPERTEVVKLTQGAHYKFEILTPRGELLLKADPLGVWHQASPGTASLLAGSLAPVPRRTGSSAARRKPMSIYELHAGSWRRHVDGRHYTYDELADELVPYVKDLGFTHIEFMPLAEHPFEGSWGYQPVGLFAPASRFGAWQALQRLVNRCHDAEIGVILDWVPGHFPNDTHGLRRFDGTALYEHEDPRLGEHPDWGTLVYNFDRHEVRSFLLSNAVAWIERFGFDAIRVDAVASMLYLDYSRKPGQWLPNVHGGRENLGAVSFLQAMNTQLYRLFPGLVTIAEESTAWPGVSRPVHDGGLGFGFKWNMGWMNDTLMYVSRDPVHRSHHHSELTFGLHYAFSENYILPLSHDEVVHGKRSLIGRMPGDRWCQFANLRAYLGFMWAHPGKKLLFMGGEFAQQSEWNHDVGLDWHLLAHPEHRGVQSLVKDLNRVYCTEPALFGLDCEAAGFAWLRADDSVNSVIAFLRREEAGEVIVVVCNFTPVVRSGYRIGVPAGGFYRELLNTDSDRYGGGNVGNLGGLTADPWPMDGQEHSLEVTVPPLATVLFKQVRK